jgi:hypothetical protein
MLRLTRAIQKPLVWLYVQSGSMKGAGTESKLALPSPTDQKLPSDSLSACAVRTGKKKAPTDHKNQSLHPEKAELVVQFAGTKITSDLVSAISKNTSEDLTADLNLLQIKNICNFMQEHYQKSTATGDDLCIGYLESPQKYEHRFYSRALVRTTNPGMTRARAVDVYSVFDIMRYDAEDALTVENQLKLAHKTALAMLQFDDTPWLPERWRLRDLSYFGSESSFDDEALKTLHLSSQISAAAVISSTVKDTAMSGIEREKSACISDRVRYGIHNTVLFFLGVALLEIAHWKPIEDKMTERDDNNQVFAARRLAAGRAPLGPQYQNIVEKCLQCNFGFGTKLSNTALRTAVYNDVVCELETMIEKLKI